MIEEKRGIIESQFKEYFYDYPGHKPESDGRQERREQRAAGAVGRRACRRGCSRRSSPNGWTRYSHGLDLTSRAEALLQRKAEIIDISGATRTPYFCSGLSAQHIDESPRGLAGAGRHRLPFHGELDGSRYDLADPDGRRRRQLGRHRRGLPAAKHVFQNLGEGTYYHSGSMAIRQAVAAKTNITYKILFNDAVAMTGGQPVDGPISVHAIAHEVRANGVARIAVVSDAPEKLHVGDFPNRSHDPSARTQLDAVQRELRQIAEVSVLIYEQECATERRRRRKRGQAPDLQEIRLHQRARLRGMRRLLGGVELPQRRAKRNALRPQASDQSFHLQPGLFLRQRFLPELCDS